MTLEQLEQRVAALEKEVADLRQEAPPLRSTKTFQDSFGMFADDPDF